MFFRMNFASAAMLLLLVSLPAILALTPVTMNDARVLAGPPQTAEQKKAGIKGPPTLYGWTGQVQHVGDPITPEVLIEYAKAALAACLISGKKPTGQMKVGALVAYTPDRVNVWFGSSFKADQGSSAFDAVFTNLVPVNPAISAALTQCAAAFIGGHNNGGHCAEVMSLNYFMNQNPGVLTPGANPLIVAIQGKTGEVFAPCGTPLGDGTMFSMNGDATWGCSQFLANLLFLRTHQICGMEGDPTLRRRALAARAKVVPAKTAKATGKTCPLIPKKNAESAKLMKLVKEWTAAKVKAAKAALLKAQTPVAGTKVEAKPKVEKAAAKPVAAAAKPKAKVATPPVVAGKKVVAVKRGLVTRKRKLRI
ncbi:hypothetical protein DFH27DRAFT_556721 [Peziza echinospora]|nr:hypothetical protein DFH27DRAFT_556721 [Peziza echinospora]